MRDKTVPVNRVPHRKHYGDMRIDQTKLRIVLLSQLIDQPSIKLWMMNQGVNHALEYSQGISTASGSDRIMETTWKAPRKIVSALSGVPGAPRYRPRFGNGRRSSNLAPLPFCEGASCAEPPASSIRFRTIASPRPVPRCRVVKKGSQIFASISRGMPGPLSVTANSISSPSAKDSIITQPPAGED